MKRISIISLFFTILFLLGNSQQLWAQLASSGTWNATTVATHTVTLNGNVNINGTITIPQGVTLTIHAGSYTLNTYTGTITATDNCSAKISFNVFGTLIITGTSPEAPAILDGGNSGEVGNINGGGENAVSLGSGFTKAGRVILVNGKGQVKLQNVKAQNLFAGATASYAAFLQAAHHADNPSSVDNRAKIDLTDVIVTNCLNANDFGVIGASGAECNSTFILTRTNINHCMVKATKENNVGIGYGGVLKGSGSSDCNLIMENCSMSYCWGSGWGGAILWAAGKNGCKASIKNSTFSNNYARYLGGALSTEAVLELEGCTIENNTAGYGGGGIAAFPFTLSSLDNSTDQQAVGLRLLTGNTIKGNKTLYITNKGKTPPTDGGTSVTITQEIDHGFNPRYTILNATDVYYPSGGGGLWVLMNKDGWNCELVIGEGNTISGNTSAYNGGGVFLYKQRPYTTASGKVTFLDDYTSGTGITSMTIKATIEKNITAKSGGGAAIGCDAGLSSFPSVTVNGGVISENTAKDGNGGGIYMPGGAFTIEGDGATITENSAESITTTESNGNGGGISITNGTFSVATNITCEVSDNEASRYGGGLYVYNPESSAKEVTFNGGIFKKNDAKAGGGICVEGNISLTMNGNIEQNNATNGGGIYLNNGSSMLFGNGLIRNNKATSTTALKNSTAFKQNVETVSGIGGGLFLAKNTSLTFTNTQSLGLYGNRATNGADDIFANGDGTEISLPNVTNMTLKDFDVITDVLYWVEDYLTGDTDYESGTKIAPAGTNIVRYRDALTSLSDKYYRVELGATEATRNLTEYVCLALGYEIVYVTLTKYGLKNGETAMFELTPQKDGVFSSVYMRVMLTGTGAESVSQVVALPSGIWKIKENNWSWAYDSQIVELTQDIDKPEGKTFVFKNTPKEILPPHDEHLKINVLPKSNN